jgi:molybdate transport repressor ModE-like protein
MLNVHRMRILREIASRGGVAAAAEAMYMTPSAVSQQMSALEREAGAPLLERAGRTVRLTEAGERLVAQTERVLAVLEQAQAELEAVAGGVTGRLRVCAFPTAARALLVPALALLRRLHPHLTFTMTDLEPQEGSLPELKSGHMDVIVTHGFDHMPDVEDPGVERVALLTERLQLAVPAGHPSRRGR